jgi:hypothetical protein
VLSIQERIGHRFKDCKIEILGEHANTTQSNIATKTISCM